jgi:hypothetical protein
MIGQWVAEMCCGHAVRIAREQGMAMVVAEDACSPLEPQPKFLQATMNSPGRTFARISGYARSKRCPAVFSRPVIRHGTLVECRRALVKPN